MTDAHNKKILNESRREENIDVLNHCTEEKSRRKNHTCFKIIRIGMYYTNDNIASNHCTYAHCSIII